MPAPHHPDDGGQGGDGPQGGDPSPAAVPPRPHRPRWAPFRRVVAWVLVIVVAILVPLSVTTDWVVGTLTNTDQYVKTVAPLVREKVVTDRIAVRGTDKLFATVNVQQKLDNALPKKADFLAAPLTNQLHAFVQDRLERVLQSQWFHQFWDAANRKLHAKVVSVLTGKPLPNGQRVRQVAVDLTPALTKAVSQLDKHGVTVFNSVVPALKRASNFKIQLVSSEQVSKARHLFSVVQDLGWLIPLITLLLLLAALGIAVDRRKTLLRAAVGSAAVTALLLGALVLVRSFFVSRASARGADPQATGAVFDTLVRYLADGLRTAVLIEVLVALLMVLIGPSRPARALRTGVVRAARWVASIVAGYARADHSVATRRFLAGAAWANEHRQGLRLAGAIVAGAVFVFGSGISASAFWITVIVLAAYLVVLELLLAWGRHLLARQRNGTPPPAPPGEPITRSGPGDGGGAARGARSGPPIPPR